jgi:hypothetical protein
LWVKLLKLQAYWELSFVWKGQYLCNKLYREVILFSSCLLCQTDDKIMEVCFKMWLHTGHMLNLWSIMHLDNVHYSAICSNVVAIWAVLSLMLQTGQCTSSTVMHTRDQSLVSCENNKNLSKIKMQLWTNLDILCSLKVSGL